MRIRKNSRLINGGNSSLAASSSASPLPSSSSTFLICQLNRSPWDVLDASALKGNWEGIFESASASDSLHSGESMELSFEYIEKPPTSEETENGSTHQIPPTPPPPLSYSGTTTAATAIPPLPPKKAAANSAMTTTQPKKRGRPRKQPPTTTAAATTAGNNNPYEYYYYSGFGPSWAKRRGAERPIEDEMMIINTTTEKMKIKETKQKLNMRDDAGIKGNGNGVTLVVDSHHKLDYIDEYDDDEDDDDDLYGGRRRSRKPIKARSLKSLM